MQGGNSLLIHENGNFYSLQFDQSLNYDNYTVRIRNVSGGTELIDGPGRSLTFVGGGSPGLNDWNGITTVTSPGGTSVFELVEQQRGISRRERRLDNRQRSQRTLTGKEYDTQNGSMDLTDAGGSLTISAGASLSIGSELDLGSGPTNGGVALDNSGRFASAAPPPAPAC